MADRRDEGAGSSRLADRLALLARHRMTFEDLNVSLGSWERMLTGFVRRAEQLAADLGA